MSSTGFTATDTTFMKKTLLSLTAATLLFTALPEDTWASPNKPLDTDIESAIGLLNLPQTNVPDDRHKQAADALGMEPPRNKPSNNWINRTLHFLNTHREKAEVGAALSFAAWAFYQYFTNDSSAPITALDQAKVGLVNGQPLSIGSFGKMDAQNVQALFDWKKDRPCLADQPIELSLHNKICSVEAPEEWQECAKELRTPKHPENKGFISFAKSVRPILGNFTQTRTSLRTVYNPNTVEGTAQGQIDKILLHNARLDGSAGPLEYLIWRNDEGKRVTVSPKAAKQAIDYAKKEFPPILTCDGASYEGLHVTYKGGNFVIHDDNGFFHLVCQDSLPADQAFTPASVEFCEQHENQTPDRKNLNDSKSDGDHGWDTNGNTGNVPGNDNTNISGSFRIVTNIRQDMPSSQKAALKRAQTMWQEVVVGHTSGKDIVLEINAKPASLNHNYGTGGGVLADTSVRECHPGTAAAKSANMRFDDHKQQEIYGNEADGRTATAKHEIGHDLIILDSGVRAYTTGPNGEYIPYPQPGDCKTSHYFQSGNGRGDDLFTGPKTIAYFQQLANEQGKDPNMFTKGVPVKNGHPSSYAIDCLAHESGFFGNPDSQHLEEYIVRMVEDTGYIVDEQAAQRHIRKNKRHSQPDWQTCQKAGL